MDDYHTSVPPAEDIAGLRLPPAADDILREYDRRIGHRSPFLWRWLYEVFPRYRLSTVPERYHEAVREQKLFVTIFYTLLDDLADLHGDEATFMEARTLPFRGVTVDYDRPGVDADYLELAETTWETVETTLREAPRADEFWPVFAFDLQQPLNAMHYSCLVAEMPTLVTETGIDTYDEHNMAQFSYADIDLMFSPAFEVADFRPLREVVWSAQRLARIANWLATWERELDEGDVTSGVVVRALTRGVVSVDEVLDPEVATDDLAERIRARDIEQFFFDEWDRLYRQLLEESHCAESVDLHDYVTGMKEMRDLYLAYSDRL